MSQEKRREIGVHENDPVGSFLYAIRAEETRRQYTSKLKAFFDYRGLPGTFEEQARQFVASHMADPSSTPGSIMRFINFQKERVARKEITESTLRNYYKPIKLFCEMNDIQLGWKKIAKGIPRARMASNDRAPSLEEIRTLLAYPDRRMKAIVCTMISSGIRLGAWDYLKWGDIEPIVRDRKVAAARIQVYRGDPEEYYAFISPEAYHAMKEWMDYRASCSEVISESTWVMRDLWNAERYYHGFVSRPKKLKSSAIKRLVERALKAQGLRKPLEPGKKRHDFKVNHGFRKFFKTRAEQVMRPINVEILMGHSVGLSNSYYRPTENEVLEDYLKAVELLSIDDQQGLRKKLEEISKRVGSEEDLKSVVEQKDRRIESLEKRQGRLEGIIQVLIDRGILSAPVST